MKIQFYPLFIVLIVLFSGGATLSAQQYDQAAGLRLAWGFGGTYKHFLSEKIAVEGIVNYWSRGTLGFRYSRTRISVLVEMHQDLNEVADGLQWYAGGGAFAGFWSGSFSSFNDGNQTQVGVSGVLGLDYKFAELPINVSADWMPGIAFVGGGGFFAGAGGLAVRYTF